jgi:hypothetical protein
MWLWDFFLDLTMKEQSSATTLYKTVLEQWSYYESDQAH